MRVSLGVVFVVVTLVAIACAGGPPEAPTNLALAGEGTVKDMQAVVVAWRDNAENETAFVVERAVVQEGPWDPVLVIGPQQGKTMYPVVFDKEVAGGQRYWYRVYACNAAGRSTYTQASAVTSPTVAGASSPAGRVVVKPPC